MRNLRRIAIVLFAGLLLGGKSASAARLINVTFERDGRVLLETYYQDDGLADAATVWRYLGRKPITVAESPLVLANGDDSTRADLGGDVTIGALHAGRAIVRVRVSGLRLVRDAPSSTKWFLPDYEVERTAGIARLGPPAPPVSRRSRWIALAPFALLCSCLWWLARRSRYRREHLVK